MSAFDFVAGCSGDALELVTDEALEAFDFVPEPRRVFNFQLCVVAAEISNEFVFINEDGSQIFYTEDGEKFRPE